MLNIYACIVTLRAQFVFRNVKEALVKIVCPSLSVFIIIGYLLLKEEFLCTLQENNHAILTQQSKF